MPIFTSIGAAIFGAGTFLAGLTAAGLQVAAGIAVNLIGKAVSGSGEQQSQAFGVQGTIQAGGDIERSFIVGLGATAGSLVYANEWGDADKTPNAYNTQVICVGDLPVSGLAQVFVNGELVTLGSLGDSKGQPVLEYRKDGVDHLWIKFYDGTQTVADTFLTGFVSSADRPWGATRVGVGCPYVIATALVKDELFTGFPTYKFALNGIKLYDPSKDSTVGGVGPHRWSNPATWGGDGDHYPAVQAYNVLRGMSFGGQWFYGLQNMTAARLPIAAWIAQINKCRAPVTGATGLEPAYRSGGEIGINAPISDCLEAFLTTCQGRLAEIGGTYKMHVGAPDASVLSLTDGQILSTEEQSFTPFFGLADTINGISAKYPSQAEGWSSKVAPPLLRSDLETLDGDRRLMADVALDLVPYDAQVQRLMKSALEEARRARRHTYVLPPEAWILEPGDTIDWTSERNGYETKLFRVDGIGDRTNLDVMVDITEVDPADYDYDHATEFHPPVDGPLVISRPAPQPIIDWSVEPDVIKDDAGNDRRAAIRMNWDGVQSDVAAVEFEVRLFTTQEVVHRGRTENYSVGSILISQSIVNATKYEAHGRYIPNSDRDTLWSDWLPVTTLDIKLGPLDFDPFEGVIGFDQLGDDFAGYQAWLGQSARELFEQAQAQAVLAGDQDLANSATFAEVRREVASAVGDLSATFSEVITTAIVPIGGQLVALADAITTLTAADGSDVSTARFRLSAMTGPTGYARIGAETRVDGYDADDWRGASWYLDTPTDPDLPTRFLVNADQFIITNGTNFENPFIFDGGVAKMMAAKIDVITSGRLQSADGKFLIDLDSKRISIST